MKLCALASLTAFLLIPAGSVRAVDAGKGIRTMEFIDGEGNVRTGPSVRDKILFQPATGTQCLIVSEKGPWKEVKFDDGSTGWVHLKNLKAVEAAAAERADSNSEDVDGNMVPVMAGGPGSYVLNAVVLRQLEGKELDDVRRSFSCAGGDVYEVRLTNDDQAILCARKSELSGREAFSMRVKTAGLHGTFPQRKDNKDAGTRTVVVYEEVQ